MRRSTASVPLREILQSAGAIGDEKGRQFFKRLWEHDLIVFDAKAAALGQPQGAAQAGPARTTQRKPTWLVDVSIGSACRAAGR